MNGKLYDTHSAIQLLWSGFTSKFESNLGAPECRINLGDWCMGAFVYLCHCASSLILSLNFHHNTTK